MYERFTDRARKVMQLAQKEAQDRHHEYVGAEHLLLGLSKEGGGVGANALAVYAVSTFDISNEIAKIVFNGPEHYSAPGKLPMTPRARKVIELAVQAARDLGHNHVGTEHLLIGILDEPESVAMQVLLNLKVNVRGLREYIVKLVGGPNDEEPAIKSEAPPCTGKEISKEELYQWQVGIQLPANTASEIDLLRQENQRLRSMLSAIAGLAVRSLE